MVAVRDESLFILIGAVMLLCIVEGQKEDCLLVQELRQKTFNVLIFFSIRAEGALNCFSVPL